jgi:hypothetical protein
MLTRLSFVPSKGDKIKNIIIIQKYVPKIVPKSYNRILVSFCRSDSFYSQYFSELLLF